MRYQPRVKGGRVQMSQCVVPAIEEIIDETARRFKVSRSWVVAHALGEQFGVDVVAYWEKRDKRRQKYEVRKYGRPITTLRLASGTR